MAASRLRLTSTGESESAAKWSPDGKWISFLRQDEKKKAQVWTLSRLGGEAQKLTDVAGGVSDYAWSPDSAQLVVTSRDVDPDRGRRQARSRAEADRDRDVQVQARWRRLRRRQAPHAPVSLRHRAARHHRPDLGRVRRHGADVVARRQADRLPQRAIGDAREVGRPRGVRRRRARRGDAASAQHEGRAPRRATRVESRRHEAAVHGRRRSALRRVRAVPHGRGAGRRRRRDAPDADARSSGQRRRVVEGWLTRDVRRRPTIARCTSRRCQRRAARSRASRRASRSCAPLPTAPPTATSPSR